MGLNLPSKPDQYFIDQVLLDEWKPSNTRGYAVQNVTPSDDTFLPIATTIDNVGAIYPSLVIQYSNETSGGQSTYDFMTPSGPGQNRQGTLLATARAQDDQDDYVGDSNSHSAVDAETIVSELTDEVEAVCQRRADAPQTDFETLGSQPGPDVPVDYGQDGTEPPVRISQVEISYSWVRAP